MYQRQERRSRRGSDLGSCAAPRHALCHRQDGKSASRARTAPASMSDQLPAMLIESLQDQLSRLLALDEQIGRIEQRITAWRLSDDACRRISEIPGVGLLTATAAVAVIGDARAFKSGREFAAYLGLVPRQNGSGGKVRLGGISKRGDVYLRTLLIHGARSVISSAKHLHERLRNMLARRSVSLD